MRRLLVAAAMETMVALPAAIAQAQRAPARLFVAGDEWSLVLSRSSIAPGKAVIQFQNRGEDPHDLKLQRVGGSRVLSLPETRAGEIAHADLRLRTGTYRLWCSLPGHRALGMQAKLRVRRAR